MLPSSFNKSGYDLKKLDVENGANWKKRPEIGLDTEIEIKKLDEQERKDFFLGSRAFYIASAKYLLNVLPFDNKLLEQMKCLHPFFIKENSSIICIRYIASKTPAIIPPSAVSALVDEWLILQSETLSEPQIQEPCNSNEYDVRIDLYWNSIFSLKKLDNTNNNKFTFIPVLVKALLSLPHGNSDCERGFSINNQVLDNRSNLSLHTINGLRCIKSHIQDFEKLSNIELTSELLQSVKKAHKTYRARLEAEKVEKKKDLLETYSKKDEINLKEEEKVLQGQLAASQKMLNNAQNMIDHGLKRKCYSDIESGQVLLKESSNKISDILNKLEKNRQEQHTTNKRKKT